MWLVFALLSAIFNGIYFILIKLFLQKTDKYLVMFFMFLFSGVLAIAFSVNNFFYQSIDFYIYAFITGLLMFIGVSINYIALEKTDISLALPMLSFTPVFSMFIAIIIFGEIPSILGFLGIFLVFLGSYIINFRKGERLLDPIRKMFRDKGVALMILTAFVFALSANGFKIVTSYVGPMLATGGVYFFAAIFSLPIFYKSLIIQKNKIDLKSTLYMFLPVYSVIVSDYFFNHALDLSFVSYVTSIRRSSIIIGILFGYFILKEKNTSNRLFASLVMLLGIVLMLYL